MSFTYHRLSLLCIYVTITIARSHARTQARWEASLRVQRSESPDSSTIGGTVMAGCVGGSEQNQWREHMARERLAQRLAIMASHSPQDNRYMGRLRDMVADRPSSPRVATQG